MTDNPPAGPGDTVRAVAPPKGRPRSPFRGRRHGKSLRPGQRRLVDELLPRLRLADVAAPWRSFSPPVDKIWLEIGFGGGEHLTAQARARPDIGFIGAEPFINGVAKVLSAIDREGLGNIRLHDDEAASLLDGLPDASIDRVFLLFADPWPKRRHHKRRFVSTDNLDRLARVLGDDAELRFASDHAGYVAWALERLTRHRAFRWLARRPADWRLPPADWQPTRYQQKAEARGDNCTFLRFRRRRRHAAKPTATATRP